MARIIPPKTRASGLYAWWTFKDTTPRNIADDPGFNGTIVGSPTVTNGFAARSNAIGSNAYLLTGTDYVKETTHKITPAASYMVRIRATSFTPAYTGIIQVGIDQANFLTILVKSNGKLAIYKSSNSPSGATNYDGTGSNTLVAGRPYHLACTYGPNLGLVGYVDGIKDNSSIYQATNYNGSSLATHVVGTDFQFIGLGRQFAGVIGDVRFYSRELLPQEVFAIAQEPYQANLDIIRTPILQAGGGFISAWAAQTNLPVIGAGTQ